MGQTEETAPLPPRRHKLLHCLVGRSRAAKRVFHVKMIIDDAAEAMLKQLFFNKLFKHAAHCRCLRKFYQFSIETSLGSSRP